MGKFRKVKSKILSNSLEIGKLGNKEWKNKEFYNTKFKFDLRTFNRNNNFKLIFNIINYIMNFICLFWIIIIYSYDYLGRILLIPMAISKIQVNHNIWRIIFASFRRQDQRAISLKYNMIFTRIIEFFTTLLASAYQNIVGNIFWIGCCCVVFPVILIPPIMYIYDCGLPKSHWKVTDDVDKMITDEAASVSSDCY